MILTILDDSPGLLRYWEPPDGSAVPTDIGDAVSAYLRDKKNLVPIVVITADHDTEYRVVAIDTASDKIRDMRIGLRETRL